MWLWIYRAYLSFHFILWGECFAYTNILCTMYIQCLWRPKVLGVLELELQNVLHFMGAGNRIQIL